MTDKLKEKGRSTLRGIRILSLFGATALILVLGVAIIVPGSVISASNNENSPSLVVENLASAPSTNSLTEENPVFEPVLASIQDVSSDPIELMGGGDTPPEGGTVYIAPIPAEGGTCN